MSRGAGWGKFHFDDDVNANRHGRRAYRIFRKLSDEADGTELTSNDPRAESLIALATWLRTGNNLADFDKACEDQRAQEVERVRIERWALHRGIKVVE